jgi:uncharacterized protein YndB with AHSA1/START domain
MGGLPLFTEVLRADVLGNPYIARRMPMQEDRGNGSTSSKSQRLANSENKIRTMDIDVNAPVITRDEILIDAPLGTIWSLQTDISSWSEWLPDIDASTLEGPLEAGRVFRWQTYGLSIESTIQEIDAPRRIVWSGLAQGITAIHAWTMRPSEDRVLVHTEESWDGEPVRAQPEEMQQALDGSLRAWLQSLKHKAEAQAQGR